MPPRDSVGHEDSSQPQSRATFGQTGTTPRCCPYMAVATDAARRRSAYTGCAENHRCHPTSLDVKHLYDKAIRFIEVDSTLITQPVFIDCKIQHTTGQAIADELFDKLGVAAAVQEFGELPPYGQHCGRRPHPLPPRIILLVHSPRRVPVVKLRGTVGNGVRSVLPHRVLLLPLLDFDRGAGHRLANKFPNPCAPFVGSVRAKIKCHFTRIKCGEKILECTC